MQHLKVQDKIESIPISLLILRLKYHYSTINLPLLIKTILLILLMKIKSQIVEDRLHQLQFKTNNSFYQKGSWSKN